jgi:hypothetical protein
METSSFRLRVDQCVCFWVTVRVREHEDAVVGKERVHGGKDRLHDFGRVDDIAAKNYVKAARKPLAKRLLAQRACFVLFAVPQRREGGSVGQMQGKVERDVCLGQQPAPE